MTNENDAIKNLPESLPDDLKAVRELQKIQARISTSRIPLYVCTFICVLSLGLQISAYGIHFLAMYSLLISIIFMIPVVVTILMTMRQQKQIELLKTVVFKLHEESLQRKKSESL